MTLKRYQKAIIITISVLVAVIAVGIGIYFALSRLTYDHDYHIDVRKIAKNDYGCDRIIWLFPCGNTRAVLPAGVSVQSKELYCVAAEKDGEEVILFIPSNTEKEKGFFAQWKFDYTFTEIVEKMESVGIVMPEFNDSDGVYGVMELADYPLYIDEENNLDTFDFPAYFQYEYSNGGISGWACFAAQINHEIKIYIYDYETEESLILC